ncbi:SH3 domain-containing protein [Sphingomicrobium aestuariivivum]|uniref:SH3 domain-containing protein n=1 Tax=Sphingomicrobium aestuariivivum TaxID=1582356 RepID=UPI001FD6A0C8|nr:SH3 domain-containing protein [Sphingomicrobium aestuariivivum]MCJ8190376.1 SH3 domain-containing protein [Sphingomicrobium aestuariivivum]
MNKLVLSIAGIAALAGAANVASAQDEREVPYWASISSGEAMMRSGPGRTYPGQWLYQRRDLPVKIVQRYDNWRKIEDPDGTTGWMSVALLTEVRTGMVTRGAPLDMRISPSPDSAVRYRLEEGVVGRLDACNGTVCRMRVGEAEGWVLQERLWGVDEDESFE